MKAKVLFLTMAFGGCLMNVHAEPSIQAGDTLESLSQVKITTATHPKSKVEATNTEQQVQAAAPVVEDTVSVEDIDQPEIQSKS